LEPPQAPIIRSSAPLLREGWIVPEEPALQIGVVSGNPDYQFGPTVWDATRLADGRIAASDQGSSEIRIFDSDGAHVSTLGGRGQGPGEFGGPPWINASSGGGIVAWDPRLFRFSWFDSSGELLRDVAIGPSVVALRLSVGPTARVWDLAEDGRLLFFSTPVEPVSRDAGGIGNIFRRAVLIGYEGEATRQFGGLHPFSQTLEIERPDGVRVNMGNPWAPLSSAASGGQPLRVAISSGSEWEIQIFAENGAIERVIRAEISRFPLTRDMISTELDRLLASGIVQRNNLSAGQVERGWGQLSFPDSIPAIATLDFDETGHLWVGRRLGTGRVDVVLGYEVFDPEGEWITSVEMPPELAGPASERSRILEFGDDYLLTQWSDEFGVPFLRMYEVLKPD
jgi:hypothetical protein